MVQEFENLAQRLEKSKCNQAAFDVRYLGEVMFKEGLIPANLNGEAVIGLKTLEPVYQHTDFYYYPERRQIVKDGNDILLTKTENKLLTVFTTYPNEILTPHNIANQLYEDNIGRENLIKVYVSRLKKKLEPNSTRGESKYLKVHWNKGYEFIDPSKDNFHGLNGHNVNGTERSYQHSQFNHYPDRHELQTERGISRLKPLESTFLNLLSLHLDRVLTLDQISQEVWGYTGVEKSIRVYVTNLRRLIEPNSKKGEYKYLVNYHGIGYKLVDPSRE